MGGYRVSTFIITWINLITLVASLGILALGIGLAAQHGECRRMFVSPVLIIGAVTCVMSLAGFIGAWKDNVFLLWIYLIFMFLVIAAVAVFTVFAFVVTSRGSGHAVSGQGFKEYRLGDYSGWLQKQTNNPTRWSHLKSCFVHAKLCENISKKYPTTKSIKNAKLSPVESGCCRPPAACGFVTKNSTYYDLTSRVHSGDKDCKTFRNDESVKCFSCNSCRAGVSEFLKLKWHRMSTFTFVLFVVLIVVYSFGCCAKRSASRFRRYAKM